MLRDHEESRTATRASPHLQARRDHVFELRDTGNDAKQPAARLQLHSGVHRQLESVLIERAETLVDKDSLQQDTGGVLLSGLGKPQRRCPRGQETLVPGGVTARRAELEKSSQHGTQFQETRIGCCADSLEAAST